MGDDLKFEPGLEQLEKLVQDLEGGELDLDEALKHFEKGVRLAKQLNQSLEEANRKVAKLVLNADGEATEEDFEAQAPTKRSPAPKKGKAKQDSLF